MYIAHLLKLLRQYLLTIATSLNLTGTILTTLCFFFLSCDHDLYGLVIKIIPDLNWGELNVRLAQVWDSLRFVDCSSLWHPNCSINLNSIRLCFCSKLPNCNVFKLVQSAMAHYVDLHVYRFHPKMFARCREKSVCSPKIQSSTVC